MPEQKHAYTVDTNRGRVNLTTPNHHSSFSDIEAFIKAHQAAINTAIGATGLVVSIYFGTKKLK